MDFSSSLGNSWTHRRTAAQPTHFSKLGGDGNSYWLLEYLFTESVILLTRQKVAFLATHRKSKKTGLLVEGYLDKIQEPAQYQGPKLVTVERQQNAEDIAKCLEILKDTLGPAQRPALVATFLQDKPLGSFSEHFLTLFKAQDNIKLIDADPFFHKVLSVKCPPEQVGRDRRG